MEEVWRTIETYWHYLTIKTSQGSIWRATKMAAKWCKSSQSEHWPALSARVHWTLSSSKKKRTKVSCQELRTTKMATEVERKRSEDGREGESSSRRGVWLGKFSHHLIGCCSIFSCRPLLLPLLQDHHHHQRSLCLRLPWRWELQGSIMGGGGWSVKRQQFNKAVKMSD